MEKNLLDKKFSFLFNDNDRTDEYVVFDTETTGLDTKKDEIISIGAVKIKKGKILLNDTLHIYVQTSKKLDAANVSIHKIRDHDLKDALTPKEAVEKFLYFIGSAPLVGYYIKFDVMMINKILKPMLGINLPNKQIEISTLYYDQKKQAFGKTDIDLRFETMQKELNIPLLEKHDALNDALMSALIFLKLQPF